MAPERTLQALSLGVEHSRRARFLEEWTGDLAAARALGLTSREILGAAARVVVLLAWLQLRRYLCRVQSCIELTAIGIAGGFVLSITGAPIAPLVPFVLLTVVWWLVQRVKRWVRTGR